VLFAMESLPVQYLPLEFLIELVVVQALLLAFLLILLALHFLLALALLLLVFCPPSLAQCLPLVLLEVQFLPVLHQIANFLVLLFWKIAPFPVVPRCTFAPEFRNMDLRWVFVGGLARRSQRSHDVGTLQVHGLGGLL